MAITETIPFNFDETYAYIEKKFSDKGYDIEEGSNTMQLVTAMSYLTSMLNANTAVNINETILPLSRKRNTTLQNARVLGYELDHIRSYQYALELQFTNDTDSDIIKKILKHTSFTSGDKTYYYMGEELEVSVPAQSSVLQTINVTEGELFKFKEEPTLTIVIEPIQNEAGELEAQHYVDIPFTNIEENGLEVFLTYYDEYAEFHNQELWKKSSKFMIDSDTIFNKEYVRIDDIDYKTPRLYFKLGDVGKEIRVGTILQVNALKSSGSGGRMVETPTPTELDAEVLSYKLVLQGAIEESLDSIKKNAPLFHNTANRVITNSDYKAFCNRFAKVKATDVWDGHDEWPKAPGHIWFSFISTLIDEERTITPTDDTNVRYELQNLENTELWFLDQGGNDADIQEIYNELSNYKVPTLVFHHRNPVFFDFEYDVNIVKYNASKTKAERNQLIFDVINEYFKGTDSNGNNVVETPVETFNFEYFQSNLNKRIDTSLTDLMGFNISLSTTISLCDRNIIEDEKASVIDPVSGEVTAYYKELRFHLGLPFEDFGTLTDINTSNLPDIFGEDIYVDYSESTLTSLLTFNIRRGTGSSSEPDENDPIVGEYRVFNDDIEVILYIVSDNGYTTGIPGSLCAQGINLEVKYPSPNIKFSRNTLPRLKTVNFV